MADQLETKHFIISGLVQGVGFRRFVEKEALTFGLSGWVRNLSDGRVEALACGTVEAMKLFRLRLQEGPRFSKVAEVVEVAPSTSAQQAQEAHEKNHLNRPRFIIR